MFSVLIWDTGTLKTCQANNAPLGRVLSSLQRPSIFIFNIFFFIQNNIRHWTIMNSFLCYWKIWLMRRFGCICVKITMGFSFFITWTCIGPCVIYCSFVAMEQIWIRGPLGINFNGWSIGNHLDNSVKGVRWVYDPVWTRQLG